MAKQLNVNLAFTADTGRAKAQLQDLQNQLTKIINTPTAGLGQDLVKDINQASYAAAELKVHLDQAMNQRTGSLDFSKLSQSLKQNNISLSEYAEKIRSIGPEGQKAFTMLAQSVASAEVPIRRSNALLSELWVTMKNTARWQLTSSVLHSFMGAIQSATGYAKDLNESLNNIRIVTGQSTEQMAEFAKEANKAAKSLSTSTLNYTDAALIYYQQGLDDTQVKERTDITIKMANVSRQSAEEVSDQMTAIWNNFNDGSQSLEHFADVMTRLGADTASSSDEIAQGLEKFASVADMIGLSFDNAAAALATVTATTRQSADVVGTAFKTIFARIQGLSLGETLDDGTNLNKYSKALDTVGINIKQQNGELKDMDSILEEMGAKWKTLSKDQQVALAQTVAGVRQYNQLIALMDNFDFYQKNLNSAQNSTGTLNKQQKIYEESWEAANDRVKASFEDIYNTLISDKFFIGFLNGLADVIDGIDSLMDHMGGLSGVIGALGLIITKVFSKQLATSISNMGYNIKNMLDGGKSVRQEKITTLQSMITSPSDTTSGELNIVEKTTNDVINAQIKSQQYLIDNAGKLNEKEQATLQILMDQQRVRGDLAIKAAEAEQQAKNRKSDAYAMVVGYHGIDPNDKNLKTIQKTSAKIGQIQASGDTSQEAKNKIAILNKTIDENIDAIAQQNKLDSQGKAHLKEYSAALVDSTQKTTARINATKEATRVVDENSNSTERNTQEARENAQAQKQAGEKIKISAEGFVKGGAAALTMVTAISSLSQAIKTMKDPDIEGWDKFSSIVMSLSMALPMLGSSLSQFGKIAVLANGQTLAQVASTTKLFGPLSKASAGFAKAAGGATTFLGSMAALLPYAVAIAAVIGLLAWGLDKLILTEKEAKENIKKANEAFAEQKQILDNLNSSLKTTKDRIDELNKQDTLTVIEKEELAKLKQEQAYLERQIILQKKLTDAGQKNQATAIKENYSKANSTLTAGPQASRYMGLVDENGSYIYESADEWFARVTQGLDETSDAYAKFEQSYKNWVAENKQITLNWLTENADAIQQAETDYQSYVQAITDGAIEYNTEDIATMQNTLSGVRKNVYSDAEYEETFLKPILTNSTAMRQADDSIYHAIAVGSDASGLINSYLQEDLLMAGVSVDEFLNYLTKDINKASENMKNLGVETSEIEKLTAEDWQIITELNFENIETADELWDALENYKNSKINIEVIGIDTLQTVLDKLNEKQKPMEDALSSYKDNGYLTMDEVQELISANSEYAKYIVKVGDSYKLTTQALTDFRDSEAKEAQALDEMIGLMGQAGQVNKDYITNYTNAWDDLIAKSAEYKEGQYSFTNENDAKLFNQRTKALKENAIAYQEGSITAEEYFTKIGDRINQINSGFHSLDDEIEENVEQTDLYEATMTAATGSIADGLADLNSQFKSGQINMDEYYKGTIAGTKALITAHSKTNKNIKKNSDGIWELKEGIDQTTVSSEDYAKAVSDIEQLNAWEKQVSQAEDMQDTVDILTDNYDYLLQYADAFGAIDFTIDNNFDTTAQQFQDLCASMGEELIDLETNNKASYQRILQGILDQGIQLANGLDTSASELQASMSKDATLASAVINASMVESGNSISSVSQAAGNVLSSLGELISNFDYTLKFNPKVSGSGSGLASWAKAMFTGDYSKITFPQISMGITGSGGESVNNFVNALNESAAFLSRPDNNGMGQGGIFDYGKESEDWTPLDPNKIKTDNIRDKGNKYKPEEDRYYEITKEIEKQERALKRLQKTKDQAYGANKLKAIDDEIAATKKLKEANEELYRQQKEKLDQDAKALLSLFPQADIANGYIANYNELLLKTTSEEQKKILDQYASTWEAMETTYDKLLDFDNQIKDLNYEKIQYKLELKVDIEDAELKRLDYFLNKFSDDFYKMAESAVLMMDKIEPTSNLLDAYKGNVNELNKAYQNGDISQEKYIDGLKNARDAIYEQLEALNELDKQMLHYYEDTLSAATDELADHTDHMEHLTSVFEHYQNLLSIIGKSKDYEAMGNFLQGQADTIKDRLSVAQSYYEVLLQQKDEIQAELKAAIESGDEAKIEMYQKEWDAIVDETDAAQEQVLSLTEEWAEAMKSVIQNNMEKIADTLEKTLTGGTTFDTLMDGFDKLNTRQEEYLTKTNQIYETNKLMRTASKALDETDNKVAKQKIKNFIDETKGLQETTQLSKYELEIQQAKYDLLLAQIALEEAQNAKSTVRLSRDSEGNFGYVYTADQNKVDDAQQAVDDADNKLYNLSLKGQQQYTEKYLQAEQAMYEELKQLQQDYLDGNIASEEEYELRKSQIQEHYLGPDGVLTTYSKLYNVAVQTDANATADYWGQEYGRMTQDTEAWKTAVNDYLLEIDDQIEDWKDVQNQANKEVGKALSNSKKATEELTTESKKLRDTLKNKVIPAIEDEIDAVREQTDAYADQRQELLDLIATYEEYLALLDKQIANASGQQNRDIDFSFEASKAFVSGNSEGVSSNLTLRKDKTIVGVNTSVSDERLGNVFAAASGSSSYTKQQQNDAKDLINKVAAGKGQYTDETLSAIGFRSGGYTGAWGPEGKLAILHEKELILNQDDTQNILSTVSLIRELVNMIDTQAASASLFNLMSTPSPNPNTNTLEQKVEITAEFPNVNDRYEIEEAFNNLVNRASQYANKAF